MTDKQDPHAELMARVDWYADTSRGEIRNVRRSVLCDFSRRLTDRLEQAEQEIAALTLSVSNRDARIAELETRLEIDPRTKYDGIDTRDATIRELEAQLEAERLRLAACGVAALMNTRDSTKDRIGKDNPFHSGSYSDVCRAVDREIEYREQLEAVGAGGVGAMVPPVPRLKLTRENIDSAARFAIESDLLPPEEWEAAGLYDFAHAVSGGVSVVDDLAALVRRIAYSLRKAAPGNNLVEHALDYLKRHGLDGSPLRQGDSAAQPAPAVVGPVADASITLDLKMATELLEMFGGEPAEITLQIGDGHSGKGVYAHYTDMPEEGAEFLGMPDDEAIPSTQPHQIAEPASQDATWQCQVCDSETRNDNRMTTCPDCGLYRHAKEPS